MKKIRTHQISQIHEDWHWWSKTEDLKPQHLCHLCVCELLCDGTYSVRRSFSRSAEAFRFKRRSWVINGSSYPVLKVMLYLPQYHASIRNTT